LAEAQGKVVKVIAVGRFGQGLSLSGYFYVARYSRSFAVTLCWIRIDQITIN